MPNPLTGIYAGLDVDMQVHLYRIVDGQNVPVVHDDWLEVLDALGAEPGEMLVVRLERDSNSHDADAAK